VWLQERSVNIQTPHGKDLHGAKLKQALSRLFEEYATDIVVKKLVPFANSQRNESFNNIVSSKNPTTHFYGGSESNDYRVACAVAQKNIGYFICMCQGHCKLLV
jgi:hypothetical protein